MQAKLTLSLEKDVIEQVKEYAHRQHKSLSKLVENYLRLAVRKEDAIEKLPPIVASLAGSLPMTVSDKGRDEITAYLEEKCK